MIDYKKIKVKYYLKFNMACYQCIY